MEEDQTRTKLTTTFLDVETQRTWRGKTGGYFRTEITILRIVDSHGQDVQSVWHKDWTMSAPGIETRNADEPSVLLGGPTKYETCLDRCVRVYRDACPVLIQFGETSEYVDYDDSQYSSRDDRRYWVRYESSSE